VERVELDHELVELEQGKLLLLLFADINHLCLFKVEVGGHAELSVEEDGAVVGAQLIIEAVVLFDGVWEGGVVLEQDAVCI
jgi:hypothetical protein